MQISLNWLNEFIDLSDIDNEQIAYQLTVSGLEVEKVEELKPAFTNIVTAKIEKIDNHPNADKLHLVTVNTGKELKTVVCGAQNIEEGQIIPYASVGSLVLDRKTGESFTLTPASIRGVESQGMLCSADELGVADRNYQEEDGILILNRIFENVQLGTNLEQVLGFEKDIIFHVAPTANRGDQMSMLGVARELSAIFDKPLNFSFLQQTQNLPADKFKVEIIDEDVCKYYSIGLLKDIKIKPSPDWMQKRLLASGIRAINNVVDITNYVLMEYGTPLHAFDADKLNGYLCVRRAKDDEKIITLDEVERTLTSDSVLIATKEKGVCLAGVFGGANSEVDDNTVNIALEAAYFTPTSNRKSSRSVGYRSEACARFERGVDICAVKPALLRAMQLLTDLADAKVVGISETGNNQPEQIDITLRFSQVKRVLGLSVEPEKCLSILECLGFTVLGKNEIAAKISVPSFRADDVTREIDLIEEIARIYGFDKIAPSLPNKSVSPVITLQEKLLKKVREIMSECSLDEIITSSLIGEPLLNQFDITYDKENAVRVKNSQSEEFTMLRQTLAGNILNCLKYNYDNGQKVFWGYEIGKTYLKVADADTKNAGVCEKQVLTGIITGDKQVSKWQNTGDVDFYTVKGIVEKLLKELEIEKRTTIELLENSTLNETHNTLHPYRTAVITLLGSKPQVIGYYGQLNPQVADKMKLNQNAYLFKLDLDAIFSVITESTKKFKKLSNFPEVQRDIAFVVSDDISWDQIKKIIKKSVQNNIFNGCEVFDIYKGEHIQDGCKSIACRIKLQDSNATLTDEKIEEQMALVRHNLKKSIPDISFRE